MFGREGIGCWNRRGTGTYALIPPGGGGWGSAPWVPGGLPRAGPCPLGRDGHIAKTENSQNPQTGPHLRARNFTSRHENYAGIDRTHRELHFLPSLATQLSKLGLGGPPKVGVISQISLLGNRKINDFQGIMFMKIKVLGQKSMKINDQNAV